MTVIQKLQGYLAPLWAIVAHYEDGSFVIGSCSAVPHKTPSWLDKTRPGRYLLFLAVPGSRQVLRQRTWHAGYPATVAWASSGVDALSALLS